MCPPLLLMKSYQLCFWVTGCFNAGRHFELKFVPWKDTLHSSLSRLSPEVGETDWNASLGTLHSAAPAMWVWFVLAAGLREIKRSKPVLLSFLICTMPARVRGNGDNGKGNKSSRVMIMWSLGSRPSVHTEASNTRSLLWRIFQHPVKPTTYVTQCEAKAELKR